MENPFSLAGKVAMVTGANGGIGRSIALSLRKAGATVIATGRNPEKNSAVAAELGEGHRVISLEVRDETAVENAVSDILAQEGHLDILVNNAGIARRGTVLESPTQNWTDLLDTHLTGAFNCARALARPLSATGEGGKVINIGSMYSIFGPPNAAGYAAAKTGMVGLTRALAVEWAEYNIQVNAILPGWHVTDLNRSLLETRIGEDIRRKTPARRLGRPDDLGETAVFLASPAADFITGQCLTVDGGYSVADRRWDESV